MRVFKYVLMHIWLWVWAFPSTFIGFLVFIYFLICGNRKVLWFNGTVVMHGLKNLPGYASIGPFIFIIEEIPKAVVWGIDGSGCGSWDYTILPYRNVLETLVHEYGHTLQNVIVGPLWLFIFGIPSLLWAGFMHDLVNKYRIRKGKECRSYYWFYTERSANLLSGYYYFCDSFQLLYEQVADYNASRF